MRWIILAADSVNLPGLCLFSRRATPRFAGYGTPNIARSIDLVLAVAPVDRRPRPRLLDPVEILGRRVLDPGASRGNRTGDVAAGVAAPGERIAVRLDRRIVAARRRRLDRARRVSRIHAGARG